MNIGIESQTVEFKESLTQIDKGLKSLVAMLNKNRYAELYFGVDDNGEVVGLDIGKNTLMNIRQKIANLIEPKILYEISELTSTEGQKYLKITARGADAPYSCDGRYYIRNVCADEQIPNHLLRKILLQSDNDAICEIPSNNQNLTFNNFLRELAANAIHTKDSKEMYAGYKLYTDSGKYNKMAFLLSDQCDIPFKLIKFQGTDKSSMSEMLNFGGDGLLTTVRKVLEYTAFQNTNRVDLSTGVRVDMPLFDFEAFREAWINACLHNDWTRDLPPSVFMYDDRIEIISYGGLPYNLSSSEFFAGRSMPVNLALFTLFLLCRHAEQSGHGVPIIVSKCGREAFQIENDYLIVTIKFAYEPDSVKIRKMGLDAPVGLTDNQTNVYNAIKSKPHATLDEIAKECSLSVSGVKKIMAKLQEFRIVERAGAKKDGRWEIQK